MTGEHDRTPNNGAQLASSLPNGGFRLVDGAGHYVSFERPAPLREILREAIDSVDGCP